MKPYIFSIFAAFIAAGFAQASVTATTTPVGYTTTTIYSNYGVGAPKTSVIGTSLVNPTEWAGTIASKSGDTLTLTSAALTSGAFNELSSSPEVFAYYIITPTGGYWAHIVSNTATSVTVQTGYGASFTVGESVVIRRHLTITDVFGNNSPGLLSDTVGDLTTADNIILIDEVNSANVTIFPTNVLGGTWSTDGFADAANYPIYPDMGIQVSRLGTGDLSLVHSGTVNTIGNQLTVHANTNLRPNAIPVSTTLTALNLYTGNVATGVASSDSGDITQADTVSVIVNGSSSNYFYSTVDLGSGPGWYDDGFAFAGTTPLPAGAGLIINRTNPTNSSPFVWVAPGATVAP